MFITNIDEVVPVLRSRLRDYISLKLGTRANARKIKCFVHSDNDPSMHFNPKANDETLKCFSCGWSGDIFAAAAHLDNLPSSGAEWVTQTIPQLCKELSIPIKLGEISPVQKEKIKQYKICQDVFDIISNSNSDVANSYIAKRNWAQTEIAITSISEEEVKSELINLGWDIRHNQKYDLKN